MATLEVVSKRAVDKATARQAGFKMNQFCEGECSESKKNGRRSSTYVATIMGKPVASLCPDCAKKWLRWWDEALGLEVDKLAA